MATQLKNSTQYQGIWVFVEQKDGAPRRVGLELLGKARQLADTINTDVTALLIGESGSGHAQELILYGADRVLAGEDPVARDYRTEVYTQIIAEQITVDKPDILLMGATWMGRDLAPRVAAAVHTGCTSDCTDLEIDSESGLLKAIKPFLGRNVMADIVCPVHRPQMATVRPGIFDLPVRDEGRAGEVIPLKVHVHETDAAVKVVATEASAEQGVRLEEAEKIVAVGMGAGDEAGFEQIRELAELLGAELGSTTLPIDAGWLTESHKIGQTGKSVRPRLYVACGISGAVQHTVGMVHSELIIAINKDPRADIFHVADYGIVGDLGEVVPAIIVELKSLRS